MLDKAGNSNAHERTDLMGRLNKIFPKQPISSMSGDREFIGERWMNWLESKCIPFVLRLKGNMRVSAGSFELMDSCLIFIPFGHYDEPEILLYENPSICPKDVDVTHCRSEV